jgi:F-type H+-transporting ATPase subunit epsilon
MSGLELKIITPDKVVYDATEISSVTLPTMAGEITVLPGHIPLIAPIKTGEAHLMRDGEMFGLALSGGIVEVRDGTTIVVLAERGEFAHDIDIARAEDAYKRAEEAMKLEVNVAEVDYARFQSLMEKELNRINVGKKWRK